MKKLKSMAQIENDEPTEEKMEKINGKNYSKINYDADEWKRHRVHRQIFMNRLVDIIYLFAYLFIQWSFNLILLKFAHSVARPTLFFFQSKAHVCIFYVNCAWTFENHVIFLSSVSILGSTLFFVSIIFEFFIVENRSIIFFLAEKTKKKTDENQRRWQRTSAHAVGVSLCFTFTLLNWNALIMHDKLNN